MKSQFEKRRAFVNKHFGRAVKGKSSSARSAALNKLWALAEKKFPD